MQYLLLIYSNESVENAISEAEMGDIMAGYERFGAEAGAAGALLGGERLKPVATATSVSTQNGEFTVTDGPFAETKEQLGGYYLVEAATLDEAIAWAKKIPGARMGTVEVRPIWKMGPESDAESGASAKG